MVSGKKRILLDLKVIWHFINFKQRFDVIELVNHEAMMCQLKEDLLLEKEQSIQEILKKCEKQITRERQLKCDGGLKDEQVIVSSLKL